MFLPAQYNVAGEIEEAAIMDGAGEWTRFRRVTTAFTQLAQQDFGRWFANSVVVALFVTAGRLLFDLMAGYALARLRFRGRGALFSAVIAVMAVPSVVLLIPKFLVIRQLGIYDSYPGLIVPLLTDAAGVFIMKQFFESVPASIEEAAHIDGAGVFRTFWSVVLPMARWRSSSSCSRSTSCAPPKTP